MPNCVPGKCRQTFINFSIMGNCLSRVHPSKLKVTLALFGLDNAGKTTILKCLQGEPLDTVAPTIGYGSAKIQHKRFDITIYDLGGGGRIRGIWKNYLAEIHAVIYVLDASDADRLEEAKREFHALINHPKISGKPVLFYLNKQDQRKAMDEIEATQKLQLDAEVNQNKSACRVETCSAILGTGKKCDASIRAGFQWLLNYVGQNFAVLDERVRKDFAEQRTQLQREHKERIERIRKQREERGDADTDYVENDHDDNPELQTNGNPFKNLNQIREEIRFKDSLKSLHAVGSGKLEPIREASEHEDSPKEQGQVTKLPPIAVGPSRTALGSNANSSLPDVSPARPKRILALPPPESGTDSDLEENDDRVFKGTKNLRNSADSGISERSGPKGPQIRRIRRDSVEMAERPQRKPRFSIDTPPPSAPPSAKQRVSFDTEHIDQLKIPEEPERRDSTDSPAASDTSSTGGPLKRRRKRFERFHQSNSTGSHPQAEERFHHSTGSHPQAEKSEEVETNVSEEHSMKNWGMAEDLQAVS